MNGKLGKSDGREDMEYGRKIEFEALINTRDLGGFPAAGGQNVRQGRLFRSGELWKATEKDKARLSGELGLKTIIDFRTGMEQQMKPDPEIFGAVHWSNPILDEATMGITREQEEKEEEGKDWTDQIIRLASAIKGAPGGYMEAMYQNLVTDSHARKQYGSFMRILAAGPDGATLYHCTAGKDRVGTGTALLLLALGVDRQLVAEDYMKTNEYYREQNERMKEEVYKRTGDMTVAESALSLYEVQESYIDRVFSVVGTDKASVERYLKEGLSLADREIGRLREFYLD